MKGKGTSRELEPLRQEPRLPEPERHLEPERELMQVAQKEHDTNQTEAVSEASNKARVDEDNAKKLRTAITVRVYSC